MNLWETFLSLPRPSAPGFYSVEHGVQRFRVGRSYEDYPAVLIEFAKPSGTSAPRRLANLAYTPPTAVDVTSSDGQSHRARLAVLECRATELELCTYFFRIVRSILLTGSTTTEEGFDAALDALVTLFRSLQRPGVRTIQGLWGELAVILWSADPEAAVSSWHSTPHALHDFTAGSYRLEVKASSKGLREHVFLLDQLATLTPGATLVASLLIHESNQGDSVFELVEAINKRLGRASVARLETIVADSLGNNWRDATGVKFALEEARRSLRIYAAEDVPTIPQPIPPQVKEVTFTVDLSETPVQDLVAARSRGDLFSQILPLP